ncbi:hypothetical protein SprV_0200608000 [Sparganum proliferum]
MAPAPTTNANNCNEPPNTDLTTAKTCDADSAPTSPHRHCTFTSRIGLVGHLRTLLTETGESVQRAPTHTRRIRFHCPHCPSTFIWRMGPHGHMPIHDTGIHRGMDPSGTPYTPIMPGPINIPSPSAPITNSFITITTEPASDSPNLFCPTDASKAEFCQGSRLKQQRSVLNFSYAISDTATDRLPQVEINIDLDPPPSLLDTICAMQQLSDGKTPDSDAIPAEI